MTLYDSAGVTYNNVRIVCNAGTNLTLQNVKIDNSALSVCALSFTGQGNTLTLTGENMLKSGNEHPGVKVASGTTLVIEATDGTGSLTANGGSDCGAGIGGGAVGGGGGIITISGGSVKAEGGAMGPDIGGTPTNGQTPGEDVFLTTVTIEDDAGSPVASTPIVSVTTVTTSGTSYAYGTEDMETDAVGNLYLYLPVDTRTKVAKTATFRYAGLVITSNNPADSIGTLSYDAVAPAVYSVTPSGAGSPRSGDIAIAFDEEMREGPGAVSLSPDGAGYSPLGAGSWSVANARYTYTTSYSGLDYSTRYTVKIEGFRDFNGNEMAPDTSHTFITVKRERQRDGSEDVSSEPFTRLTPRAAGRLTSPSTRNQATPP